MKQTIIPPKNANQNEQDLSMVCHLLGLCGLVLPFLNIGAPLMLWLWKKDRSYDLDQQGREVINFQLSWTIYFCLAWSLTLILIGFLLLPLVGITWAVLVVLGALTAKRGLLYRYPLTIRFL